MAGASLTRRRRRQPGIVDHLADDDPGVRLRVLLGAGQLRHAEVSLFFLGPVSAASTSSGWRSWGAIALGGVAKLSTVWDVADISMGLMAIVNLIAIVLLGKWAFAALRNYHSQAGPARTRDSVAEEAALPPARGDIWTRSARSSLLR